jgi:hypothetical protein
MQSNLASDLSAASTARRVSQLATLLANPLMTRVTDGLELLQDPVMRFADFVSAMQTAVRSALTGVGAKSTPAALYAACRNSVLVVDKRTAGKRCVQFAAREIDGNTYAARLDAVFGRNGQRIATLSEKQVKAALRPLQDDARAFKGTLAGAPKGSVRLFDYTPFLADFERRTSDAVLAQRMEVPGQYAGDVRPQPETHARVCSFAPSARVMSSLRRPRVITMRASDHRDRVFLVKGGEDLRLDQRIIQLLRVMNGLLASDARCAKRQLGVATYDVAPLSRRVGLIEWVPDTETFKSIIQKQHAQRAASTAEAAAIGKALAKARRDAVAKVRRRGGAAADAATVVAAAAGVDATVRQSGATAAAAAAAEPCNSDPFNTWILDHMTWVHSQSKAKKASLGQASPAHFQSLIEVRAAPVLTCVWCFHFVCFSSPCLFSFLACSRHLTFTIFMSPLRYYVVQHGERAAVVRHFRQLEAQAAPDLMLRGLAALAASPESLVAIRSRFARSFAAFTTCSWVLGIGDRHLDNFLLDTTTGGVVGIDFGHAMGTATHLPTPELMPFRLTRQLLGVLSPLDTATLLKADMTRALTALRARRDDLLTVAAVFVREPHLDWVAAARKTVAGRKGAVSKAAKAGDSADDEASRAGGASRDAALDISWYPREKINGVRRKLLGENPCLGIERGACLFLRFSCRPSVACLFLHGVRVFLLVFLVSFVFATVCCILIDFDAHAHVSRHVQTFTRRRISPPCHGCARRAQRWCVATPQAMCARVTSGDRAPPSPSRSTVSSNSPPIRAYSRAHGVDGVRRFDLLTADPSSRRPVDV